eukprot:7933840-Pyramimonas_sp.AAC.1
MRAVAVVKRLSFCWAWAVAIRGDFLGIAPKMVHRGRLHRRQPIQVVSLSRSVGQQTLDELTVKKPKGPSQPVHPKKHHAGFLDNQKSILTLPQKCTVEPQRRTLGRLTA